MQANSFYHNDENQEYLRLRVEYTVKEYDFKAFELSVFTLGLWITKRSSNFSGPRLLLQLNTKQEERTQRDKEKRRAGSYPSSVLCPEMNCSFIAPRFTSVTQDSKSLNREIAWSESNCSLLHQYIAFTNRQ